jgi:hypothetical protein
MPRDEGCRGNNNKHKPQVEPHTCVPTCPPKHADIPPCASEPVPPSEASRPHRRKKNKKKFNRTLANMVGEEKMWRVKIEAGCP